MASVLGGGEREPTRAPGHTGPDTAGSLVNLDLFHRLERATVEELVRRSSGHRADRQRVVYSQGEQLTHLYIVESGSFKLVRHSEQGKELIVALPGRGECFGAFVGPFEACTSARALQASVYVAVPVAALRNVISQSPDFAAELLGRAQQQHRIAVDTAARLAFEAVPTRLGRVLVEASDPATGLLAHPLSQTEIANLIGSSRETVCSVLNQFRRKGFLTIERGRFCILNREGLVSAG